MGNYALVMTAEMEQAMAGMKAFVASLPEKDRAKAQKDMTEAFGSLKKLELSVKADGTFKFTGVPKNGELGGTYTASGNNLIFQAAKGAKGAGTPQKVTYDPKTQTLSGVNEKGRKTVFKKKS